MRWKKMISLHDILVNDDDALQRYSNQDGEVQNKSERIRFNVSHLFITGRGINRNVIRAKVNDLGARSYDNHK